MEAGLPRLGARAQRVEERVHAARARLVGTPAPPPWFKHPPAGATRATLWRPAAPERTVNIDILPGSDRNPINLRARNGVLPVAVLTTQAAGGEGVDFDATRIDWSTVRFGLGGAMEIHGMGHLEDVGGDGEFDMVFHFRVADTGLACGQTAASLTGATHDEALFRGPDTVTLLGC